MFFVLSGTTPELVESMSLEIASIHLVELDVQCNACTSCAHWLRMWPAML